MEAVKRRAGIELRKQVPSLEQRLHWIALKVVRKFVLRQVHQIFDKPPTISEDIFETIA